MGMKQDIVLVNEFTIDGSRGDSPKNYIMDYVSKGEGKVETLEPTYVKMDNLRSMQKKLSMLKQENSDINSVDIQPNDIRNYITRYMARSNATEYLYASGEDDSSKLNQSMIHLDSHSGKAFSRDVLSLSHEELDELATAIDEEYHKGGKPFFKLVISFDEQYLKKMGVLSENQNTRKNGDLFSRCDQAKLRLAVQDGLKTAKYDFSDLVYVGAFHSNTKHIHCHLGMIDMGEGKRFTADGVQKGKLSQNTMNKIRRGVWNSLDRNKEMKVLNMRMQIDKQNTISFIKKFTNQIINDRGVPQYLLAVLPKEDTSLWKASINADGGEDDMMVITKGGKKKKVSGNMKKANAIVRSYIVDILNRPDSGYAEAYRMKHNQLMARMNRGEFDNYTTTMSVIRDGHKVKEELRVSPLEAVRIEEQKFRKNIIDQGVNTVYDILQTIDEKKINFRTPFLDAMALPYEEMANRVKDDKMIEFGFRLRSYNSRLEHHKDRYKKINEFVHQYEDGDPTRYDPEAKNAYNLFKVEQEYHHALMCKYQHFLHFYKVRDEYQEDLDELMYLKRRCGARRAMTNDKYIQRAKTDEKKEQRGRDIYGLSGASLIERNPELFKRLMADEDKEYEKALRNFKERLAVDGQLFDENTETISDGLAYDFEDVKAYDIHHMTYDYTYDFKIADKNIQNFVDMANKRYNAYVDSLAYFQKSGQMALLEEVTNIDDILIAKSMADMLKKDSEYHTKYTGEEFENIDTSTTDLKNEVYSDLTNKNIARSIHDIIDEAIEEERRLSEEGLEEENE